MTCSFLDLPCHAKSALWSAWLGLDWYVQALIILGLLLVIGGAVWGALQAVKRFGGWPAVGGVTLLVIAGGIAILSKTFGRHEDGIETPDEDPPIKRRKPKPPRPIPERRGKTYAEKVRDGDPLDT